MSPTSCHCSTPHRLKPADNITAMMASQDKSVNFI
jgi:hypothetical protein